MILSTREIKENLFVRFTSILMEKNSPLTPYINKLVSNMRGGGLIQHYWNDPLYLEQTMSMDTFTYYDDSKDKLTLETFFLISIFLACGMVLSLIVFMVEWLVFRYKAWKGARQGRRQKRSHPMYPRGPEKRRKF